MGHPTFHAMPLSLYELWLQLQLLLEAAQHYHISLTSCPYDICRCHMLFLSWLEFFQEIVQVLNTNTVLNTCLIRENWNNFIPIKIAKIASCIFDSIQCRYFHTLFQCTDKKCPLGSSFLIWLWCIIHNVY